LRSEGRLAAVTAMGAWWTERPAAGVSGRRGERPVSGWVWVRGAVVRRGGWPVAPLMPAVLRA